MIEDFWLWVLVTLLSAMFSILMALALLQIGCIGPAAFNEHENSDIEHENSDIEHENSYIEHENSDIHDWMKEGF